MSTCQVPWGGCPLVLCDRVRLEWYEVVGSGVWGYRHELYGDDERVVGEVDGRVRGLYTVPRGSGSNGKRAT